MAGGREMGRATSLATGEARGRLTELVLWAATDAPPTLNEDRSEGPVVGFADGVQGARWTVPWGPRPADAAVRWSPSGVRRPDPPGFSSHAVRTVKSVRLLTHFDPVTAEPLGVWSLPGMGEPELEYVDSDARAYAEARLGDLVAVEDWEAQAQRMAESSPYVAWWGVIDAEADTLAAALVGLREEWAGAPVGSKKFDKRASRIRFARRDAPVLAEKVSGSKTLGFDPGRRVSETLVLLATPDGERLVVLVGPGEDPGDVDAALGYGLAFQGDRDVLLVLPEGQRQMRGLEPVASWWPTCVRAAHVWTPVRVWTHADGEVVERRVLSKVEARRTTLLGTATPPDAHDLGDLAGRVEPLVAWAQQQPELEPAHRRSYLAWHAHGRQVLRLRRHGDSVEVIAGVDYSPHRTDMPAALRREAAGVLDSTQVDEVTARVLAAARNRRSGTDAENLEHQLQARLSRDDGVEQLGLVGRLEREVPASRPGQRLAFIDLLGVDASGDIHLIETKVAAHEDPMLALQGLDYWVWLNEHRQVVIDQLRAAGHQVADDPKLFLDYVVATRTDDGSEPQLRYFAPQAEALDRSMRWRLGIVSGWADSEGTIKVHWEPPRTAPTHPGIDRRFAHRMQAHLRQWANSEGLLVGRTRLKDLEAAVVPSAVPALRHLVALGLDHRHLDHVRSSQLFAVNVFGGLTAEQTTAVARRIDPTVVAADTPVLEWVDPLDRLGESTPASPHTTQVDMVIRAHRGDGRTHLMLIEVKLTEDDFGGCSAYESPDNDRRDLCGHPVAFGGEPAGCFQLRNKGNGPPRTYDTYLAAMSANASGAGCPFRGSVNQPMRNAALAASLIAAGETDLATFVLCAHDYHSVMWRRWRDAQAALSGVVSFAELPASQVLAEHDPRAAAELAWRYQLPPAGTDDRDRLAAAVDWALTVLTRVAGDGSVLDQLQRVLAGDQRPAGEAEVRELSQRLEILTELARSTRSDKLSTWRLHP